MKDVADAAGVSQMTVSRAVRNPDTLAPETLASVQRAIDSLGYVKSHMTGVLDSRHANQIAVVIPSLVNNVFPEVLAGITEELDKVSYNTVVAISEYSLTKEQQLVTSMMSWQPAGIMVVGNTHTQRTRQILGSGGIPVVEMMELTDSPVDAVVGLDHAAATETLVNHLIDRGYRNFGYIGWNENDFSAALRFNVTAKALAEAGIPLTAPSLFNRPPNFGDGKTALKSLLQNKPAVDVVMFSNDTSALGGLTWCLEQGIDVPDSLAIAGFSGLDAGQALKHNLTTIKTPRYQIGQQSAKLIVNRLVQRAERTVYDMGYELIDGLSA